MNDGWRGEQAGYMAETGLVDQPWVEKYRPHTLDDIIGQDDLREIILRFTTQQTTLNLLLAGPPGSGKTSLLWALVRHLYPVAQDRLSRVLELDASQERGIENVRNTIVRFVSTNVAQRSVKSAPFKLVIIDECDNLTPAAHNALKVVMEKHLDRARFCFLCNHVTKLNPAIVSRCVLLKFQPLNAERMSIHLPAILARETRKDITMETNPQLLQSWQRVCFHIGTRSEGDMRRALMLLQSWWYLFGKSCTDGTSCATDEVLRYIDLWSSYTSPDTLIHLMTLAQSQWEREPQHIYSYVENLIQIHTMSAAQWLRALLDMVVLFPNRLHCPCSLSITQQLCFLTDAHLKVTMGADELVVLVHVLITLFTGEKINDTH